MTSKDIRNGIIALLVLAVGIKLILYIVSSYINISEAGEIGKSMENIGNIFFYAAILIAIILIPFYLSSRNSEKSKAF